MHSANGEDVLFISEDTVRKVLDPIDAIKVVRAAFEGEASGRIVPQRANLPLSAHSLLLVMPCHDMQASQVGSKFVFISKATERTTSALEAFYLLQNSADGSLEAVLQANYLTDMRTAATSALATGLLARKDAKVLGIFGTGRQARAHVLMLNRAFGFERILICGLVPQDADSVVDDMARQHDLSVEVVDNATCASESDVICTCTTSRTPLFDGKLLREGTHLNLVGSFEPHTREVDTTTILRARVFVDTYDGAFSEAGDLLIPIREGALERSHVVGDLHELLANKCVGRRGSHDITAFESVGCALEDFAVAQLVVAKAISADG